MQHVANTLFYRWAVSNLVQCGPMGRLKGNRKNWGEKKTSCPHFQIKDC